MRSAMLIMILLTLLLVAWFVARDVSSRRTGGDKAVLTVIDRAQESGRRAEESNRRMEKLLDGAAGE